MSGLGETSGLYPGLKLPRNRFLADILGIWDTVGGYPDHSGSLDLGMHFVPKGSFPYHEWWFKQNNYLDQIY